jgi:citrate lyase subunit beta/citryl-CoA lyase
MKNHDRPQRIRRCELAVPGSSEKMMAKAAAMDVDYVFLDLEDAVAPSEKIGARQNIVKALNEFEWGRTVRSVRINDLETHLAYEDIIEVVEGARENLDVIIIPKVRTAFDVQWVALLLDQVETKLGMEKTIGLEVLIEEVEAMANVEAIAAADPRLEALIFGVGDFSAAQGIDYEALGSGYDYPPDVWHYGRNKITIAARINGIDSIDGPYPNFKDAEGYVRECERGKFLGAVGKWAIHPSQIALAQAAFTPDPEIVAHARKLKAAYLEAVTDGRGAAQVDGVLVDAASLRLFQNVLDMADRIGM